MLRQIGIPELIVIGVVFVMLFGGKAFSNLGKGIGEGIREFFKIKKEFQEAEKETRETISKT